MDILELARQAGLQVLLDARIGSQTYHSVSGSLPALQRFAEAVAAAAREGSPRRPNGHNGHTRHTTSSRHTAAARLRKRSPTFRWRRPASPHPSVASPHVQAT